MKKTKIPLVIALLLAAIAGLMTWSSIKEKKKEIERGWGLTEVLVYDTDLIEGSTLDNNMISKRGIPEQFVTNSVITPDNLRFIVGQRLNVPVKAGDSILWTQIQSGQELEKLSNTIPKSFRAVSIRVNAESSVSQHIRPNDHVDIIGIFRDPETRDMTAVNLLQNLIVLNTGQITQRTNLNLLPEGQKFYSTISLLVLPEEAEMLVLSQELGNIYLTLRNSEDIDIQEDRGKTTLNTLLTGERGKKLEKKRFNYIEVIRGNINGKNKIP